MKSITEVQNIVPRCCSSFKINNTTNDEQI